MSEAVQEIATVSVLDLDPFDSAYDPLNRKAILAMQTTRLFVDEDPRFSEANHQLHAAAQAVGRPPTATYEDLIFVNPVFDTVRTYSSNDIAGARSEAEFYKAHRVIEGHLYAAVGTLLVPESVQLEDGQTPGAVAVEHVGRAKTELIRLHTSVDRDAFNRYRPYFAGLNGYNGASGLYSETLPILDLLLHGGVNITADERAHMLQNQEQGVYPNQNDRSATLRALLLAETAEIDLDDKTKGGIIKHLDAFRRIHRGSVRKLLPEVLKGETAGSGGVEMVDPFLQRKVVTGRPADND